MDPFTVERYVVDRVDDQIKWYRQRAHEYQDKADRFRTYIFALGAVSVLLGLASAVNAISAWIAVIGTITASLTAQMKNQRYQSLIAIYSATALRLDLLKSEWADSRKKIPTKWTVMPSFIGAKRRWRLKTGPGWPNRWSSSQARPINGGRGGLRYTYGSAQSRARW